MRHLFWVLLLGCSGENVRHQFNVEIDGAVLPVQVRGNAASGKFVVFESGGPSGLGIAERAVDSVVFDPMVEERAAVVMYDRRGVGNALGDYTPEVLTTDRLVADLKAINLVLEERYDVKSRVLVGHSFGTLSSLRALQDHPQKYDGWVAIAGAWTVQDEDLQVFYRSQFACRVAQDRLDEGDTAPIWNRTLDWCATDQEDLEPLWEVLDVIDERFGNWPAMDALGLMGAVVGSHYNLVDSLMRENRISEPIWDDLDDMDAFAELERVDVPTVVIAGEYDEGVVESSVEAVERLPDGELIEIEDAGHYPFHVAPKRIGEAVLGRFP